MNLISINVLKLKIFIPIRYNDFIVFKLKMIYTVTEEYEMKGRSFFFSNSELFN